MEPYKSLDKYAKLQYIQNNGVSGKTDRHEIAVYLKALWLNNQDYIQEFEKYGEDPFKMLSNKHGYERHLLFGFKDFELNKHGWLDSPKLLNTEIIDFKYKAKGSLDNAVEVAMGKNGKWTYGISYCTGSSGGSSGPSVFGVILNNKEEAVIEGLNTLLNRHNKQRELMYKKDSCGNYNEEFSRSIVKQIQEYLDQLTGKIAIQLELF